MKYGSLCKDDSLHNLKNTILEINRETARFYYSNLFKPEGKWALDYYLSRGLTPETIKNFGLGVALSGWDTLIKHLKSKGFKVEDMLQADVVSKSNKGTYFDRFRDRTMFPVINVRGNVIAFSGRRRTEDKTIAKYVNTKDTLVYNKSQNLFALNFAKAHCSEQIILVEGNFDTVSLHQHGFKNVVAPLGTAFTKEQAQILARYTKEVILCFDSDTAGEAAIEKAFKILESTGLSVKVLKLPVGKDPDEFLKTNKPSDFEKLISAAIPETEYKLIKVADSVDSESAEAKIKFLNSAISILASNSDPIAVDYYLTKLAKDYEVSKDTLVTKLSQIKKNKFVYEKKREAKNVVAKSFDRNDINSERRGNETATSAEEMIISILLKHPDLLEFLSMRLSSEDFVTSLNKRIFVAVCEDIKNNHSFSVSSISEKFSDRETGFIIKLLNSEFIGDQPKDTLTDCIDVLKREKDTSSSSLDDDDWATQMKKIADNKKGN